MVNDWSLRKEFLTGAQRWPVVVLSVIVGALLGWLVSWVWPAPYRASAGIYVGLDTYRALEDRNAENYAHIAFNYPDDYKNWQMGNLNVLIFSQPVLESSLQKLRDQDAFWKEATLDDFSGMLDAYWRNPGKWRLTVDHADPQRAAEAALAWRDVALSAGQTAIAYAQDTLMTDIRLQEYAAEEVKLQSSRAALLEVAAGLKDLQSQAAASPGSEFTETQRAQAYTWAVQAAELGPAWQTLWVDFPAEGASADDYLPWLDHALVMVTASIDEQQAQLASIADTRQALETRYSEAASGSLGLSSTMVLESLSEDVEEVEHLRPTGLLILLGAVLGLLAWILAWLGRIAMRGKA